MAGPEHKQKVTVELYAIMTYLGLRYLKMTSYKVNYKTTGKGY